MKALKDLSSKPKLVSLVINSPEVVEEFGDELEFFILDRMSSEQYVELISMDKTDVRAMYMMLKDMILDEEGLPVIDSERTLPPKLLVEAVVKITEHMGK